MTETFSKLAPDVKQSINDFIRQRWGQLYELEKEWGERVLRYLMLTNSGGAIATLSFIGASPGAIEKLWTKAALYSFVLGVVLVGISNAKFFHYMSGLFAAWKQDVDHFYSDKITWEHVLEQDRNRAVPGFWDYTIPYIAFACFIFGCVAGAVSLLL